MGKEGRTSAYGIISQEQKFLLLQGMVQPFRKRDQNRSAQVSCNSFVRNNMSNQIKLVRFGVGPQISFINKARI